ncbi:MAG: ATP-binding protein [Planctomycetes bacterium]|nr:ATP-binding protein [Planctomycetota bacterium]
MPATNHSYAERGKSDAGALRELRLALRAFARGSEQAGQQVGNARHAPAALCEARKLTDEVEDLIALERARESRRVRCTAREIALSARLALPKQWRARLLLVEDGLDEVLYTDGRTAARALARLLRNAFEAGSELVLLLTERRGTRLCFCVLDRAPGHGCELECPPEPFAVARVGHVGIGLSLAWREAELLEGGLRLSRLQGGGTRAELELKLQAKARRR